MKETPFQFFRIPHQNIFIFQDIMQHCPQVSITEYINSSGVLVSVQNSENWNEPISAGNLKSGVYHIEIITDHRMGCYYERLLVL